MGADPTVVDKPELRCPAFHPVSRRWQRAGYRRVNQCGLQPVLTNTLQGCIFQIDPVIGQDNAILIVDDDPQVHAYYQKVLQHSQPQRRVLIANNGRQALELLGKELPGLILLDFTDAGDGRLRSSGRQFVGMVSVPSASR